MIKILKAVYSVLSNASGVTAIVGDKIFPDVIPDKDNSNENIDYPAIVMHRVSLSTEYTKCTNCKEDRAIVDIMCYSTSYNEAVDLAEEVRTALEFYKGIVEGIDITRVRLGNIAENFDQIVYIQALTFNIK